MNTFAVCTRPHTYKIDADGPTVTRAEAVRFAESRERTVWIGALHEGEQWCSPESTAANVAAGLAVNAIPLTAELYPLVCAVREHAEEHIEEGGWDVILECYSDEEIAFWLVEYGPATTVEEAIATFAPAVDVWADRQADAVNSAF